MVDGLGGCGSGAGDEVEAVGVEGGADGLGEADGGVHQRGGECGGEGEEVGEMILGDEEGVAEGGWVEWEEGEGVGVFVDPGGGGLVGDDRAEFAGVHMGQRARR